MHFRRLEILGLAASAAAGAALTPDAISGDVRRLLMIFLGLVSASVLPTISLLVSSMTASGRSVQAINQLNAELESAMDALFLLFGCVAVVVGALLGLAMKPPEWLVGVPYLTTEVLPRAGQAVVIGTTFVIIWRAGQIPAILRQALSVRHDIAIAEARRELSEKAPAGGAMKQTFQTHPDFGKVVSLSELHNQKPQ